MVKEGTPKKPLAILNLQDYREYQKKQTSDRPSEPSQEVLPLTNQLPLDESLSLLISLLTQIE